MTGSCRQYSWIWLGPVRCRTLFNLETIAVLLTRHCIDKTYDFPAFLLPKSQYVFSPDGVSFNPIYAPSLYRVCVGGVCLPHLKSRLPCSISFQIFQYTSRTFSFPGWYVPTFIISFRPFRVCIRRRITSRYSLSQCHQAFG